MKQSGVSLIELLIVVSTIGLLIVIATPQYEKYKRKAMQAEAKVSLSTLYSLERMFITNYGWGTSSFSQLGFEPKGIYHYSAGWPSQGRDGVPFNVNATARASITASPYTGPLRTRGGINMFNRCSSNANPTRNPNCLLIGNPAPRFDVPKEKSGLAEDRHVRIDNIGYRNVKFIIGAGNRNRDQWIITENKKLINVP